MKRQSANEEILSIIFKATQKWPDQRLGQLLRNLDVVYSYNTPNGPVWSNGFNEEPWHTLDRMLQNEMVQELLNE